MKKEHKIVLVGIFALALLDGVTAIAAKQYNFKLALLWPASVLIYFSTAYQGARRWNYKVGVAFATFLGIFDATVGWKITVWWGPEDSGLNATPSFLTWFITVWLVAAFAALIGLLAGGMAALLKKKKSYSDND